MAWNVHLPPAHWYAPGDPRLESLIREVADQKVVAIDTETTGLTKWKDVPLFWSLAWGERRICMPVSTLPYFREIFNDPTKDWLFVNAKYDCHMLANVGIHLAGRLIDVSVMHSLLYEEASHALKEMAAQILGWRWQDFFDTFKAHTLTDAAGVKRKESVGEMLLRCEKEDLDTLVEYASNDAYGTLKLWEKLHAELTNSPTFSLYPDTYANLADLFYKTEVPFTKVLFKCERNGILIDHKYLASLEEPALAELRSIERDIVRAAGRMLNPSSPKQLVEFFIQERKLRPLKFTKGGATGIKAPSVDVGFLEHYASTDDVAALVLKHRELSKLVGTYIKGLQTSTDPHGRIHTSFNQSTARTGRLSSSDPNLQNIPRPDNDRFKLRGAFIAKPGHKLIVYDYEQLEMRLLASAAMEEGMISIFARNWDIHMGNAAMVFGKKYGIKYEDIEQAKKIDKKVGSGELPPEALTQKVKDCLHARQAAKSVGFG